MSALDAKVEHWENWVRENRKEVVSLVKKKHRQHQDAERISNSKATHLPNRATSQVLPASPNGPDIAHRSTSPHGPLTTGTVPRAEASTTPWDSKKAGSSPPTGPTAT